MSMMSDIQDRNWEVLGTMVHNSHEGNVVEPDLSCWENTPIRVGTRKSELAMIQTNGVITKIKELYPEIKVEIVQMNTTGDVQLEVSLAKIGEKSLFTKELEQALLQNEVDFVVHSLKDLPTELPKGLIIAGITEREDPRDALVLPQGKTLPLGADGAEMATPHCFPDECVIGTSSTRRVAAIRSMCPNWKVNNIRGNVNTRLKKLDAPDSPFTALILAAAGLQRMGLGHRITRYLDKESDTFDWPYAVGQGALGLECCESNKNVIALLQKINHAETYYACVAERALLYNFGGGCSIPIGVRSKPTSDPTLKKLQSVTLEAFYFGVGSIVKGSWAATIPKQDTICKNTPAELTSIQPIFFEGYPLSSCMLFAALGLRIGRVLKMAVKNGAVNVEKRHEMGQGDEKDDGPTLTVVNTA